MEPVLSWDEMRRVYGKFFDRSGTVFVDTAQVPENLRPLVPYATFWGVADDWCGKL